ncbi:hypothetical protein IAT40_003979 [Kwoniella sp. CBS 6097]
MKLSSLRKLFGITHQQPAPSMWGQVARTHNIHKNENETLRIRGGCLGCSSTNGWSHIWWIKLSAEYRSQLDYDEPHDRRRKRRRRGRGGASSSAATCGSGGGAGGGGGCGGGGGGGGGGGC